MVVDGRADQAGLSLQLMSLGRQVLGLHCQALGVGVCGGLGLRMGLCPRDGILRLDCGLRVGFRMCMGLGLQADGLGTASLTIQSVA